jgi:hypothetical protein
MQDPTVAIQSLPITMPGGSNFSLFLNDFFSGLLVLEGVPVPNLNLFIDEASDKVYLAKCKLFGRSILI